MLCTLRLLFICALACALIDELVCMGNNKIMFIPFCFLLYPVWVKMIELGLADGSLIDELMELTAQSLGNLEIQEHFNIIKEIGRGKYGKVLLVTHRFRGKTAL